MTARRAQGWISLATLCIALGAPAYGAGSAAPPTAAAAQPSGHFHPKGKVPSRYTVEKQQALRASLPFEDQRDFEESKRGFIAAPPYRQIKAEAGNVVWDMSSYDFLLQGRIEPFQMQDGDTLVAAPRKHTVRVGGDRIGSRQSLRIYDVNGQKVEILFDDYKPAGNYEVRFDASGSPSGIYFYKLESGSFTKTKKMILLK